MGVDLAGDPFRTLDGELLKDYMPYIMQIVMERVRVHSLQGKVEVERMHHGLLERVVLVALDIAKKKLTLPGKVYPHYGRSPGLIKRFGCSKFPNRLRELHTLKGHVESMVKLKELDINTIQQHYTITLITSDSLPKCFDDEVCKENNVNKAFNEWKPPQKSREAPKLALRNANSWTCTLFWSYSAITLFPPQLGIDNGGGSNINNVGNGFHCGVLAVLRKVPINNDVALKMEKAATLRILILRSTSHVLNFGVVYFSRDYLHV
ncbi:hypothetical protein Fmac_029739 [Flemingia macrophylla]|uniref:Uncharacterized protein n=1 Tax=Flemingia macrophylla TaxID=520843 RepID=A0ABD1LB78_9FABA